MLGHGSHSLDGSMEAGKLANPNILTMKPTNAPNSGPSLQNLVLRVWRASQCTIAADQKCPLSSETSRFSKLLSCTEGAPRTRQHRVRQQDCYFVAMDSVLTTSSERHLRSGGPFAPGERGPPHLEDEAGSITFGTGSSAGSSMSDALHQVGSARSN